MLLSIYIIILLYALLIFLCLVGWKKTRPCIYKKESAIKISVVIACRNEETHIKKLLKSLRNQDYPSENIEFIFIDDHSEDNTLRLLIDEGKVEPKYPFKLTNCSSFNTYCSVSISNSNF